MPSWSKCTRCWIVQRKRLWRPSSFKERSVTLTSLRENGRSNVQIARILGVTEGTVRYRRRRTGRRDGRANKVRHAQPLAGAIHDWIAQRSQVGAMSRPPSVRALWDWLVLEHGWTGSYKAVLRFVRAVYP